MAKSAEAGSATAVALLEGRRTAFQARGERDLFEVLALEEIVGREAVDVLDAQPRDRVAEVLDVLALRERHRRGVDLPHRLRADLVHLLATHPLARQKTRSPPTLFPVS